MRLYEDDEEEMKSIIAWTERRLSLSSWSSMIVFYIRMFKQMWVESFGTLDNVPQEFKDKVKQRYDELLEKEKAESNEM